MKAMSGMLLDNELPVIAVCQWKLYRCKRHENVLKIAPERHVESLDLSKQVTKIGADGAKAIADGLLGGMPLETLNISGNDIGHEGIDHIARALKNIKRRFGALENARRFIQ